MKRPNPFDNEDIREKRGSKKIKGEPEQTKKERQRIVYLNESAAEDKESDG